MKLTTYNEKRKFDKTSEPKGKMAKSKKSRIFVVQKHAAKHLHYDFRLEIEGVLKSWAVPKGPSLDPNVKRLAVQVEDHPLEYGNFEGIIPYGNYGAGTVMLWDKGTWQEVAHKNKKQNVFYFELKGKKLKGIWKLIKIKNDPKNWLLVKGQDEQAILKENYDVLEEKALSVVSKSSMNDIFNTDLKKSKFPDKVKPQLATLVDKAPEGEAWLHEMKFDGYRLLTYIKNKINLLTRTGLDWTKDFESIANEIKKLNLNNTILDGEVVVLDKKGKPDFQLLQNAIKEKHSPVMVYYIFDILYYQGYNLCDLPLIKRKKLLEQIIPKNNTILKYSSHIIGEGKKVFEKACALGFEGIVSKKCSGKYLQKRTESWVKVKGHYRQEFVVAGYTEPKGQRDYFGALLLGYYDGSEFKYCGRVGTGFNAHSLKELYVLLEKNKIKKCPFSECPPMQDFESWVKPKIVVELEFSDITSDGILRHPSFKGIREDKIAKQVISEFECITHPQRLIYPKSDITKLDIAHYYSEFNSLILPFIITRPLSIVRCPQGLSGTCFFQKHISPNDNSRHIFEGATNLYIKNKEGLMELIQMGTLEIHPYGNRIDKPDKPDMITFDLDPGEGVSWKKIVDTAFLIKEELEKYDLISFVKTTGGNGLYVVLPIIRRYDWEYVSLFAKTFSEYLANKYPRDYISVMTKSKRTKKIYIDYLRNKPGASAVAPYSTRARDSATISMPLDWDQLTLKIKPSDFTIKTLKDTLDAFPALPWQDFFTLKQKLPK